MDSDPSKPPFYGSWLHQTRGHKYPDEFELSASAGRICSGYAVNSQLYLKTR